MTDREPATGLWNLQSLVPTEPAAEPPPPWSPPTQPVPEQHAAPSSSTLPALPPQSPGSPSYDLAGVSGGRTTRLWAARHGRLMTAIGGFVAVVLAAGVTTVAMQRRSASTAPPTGQPPAAGLPVTPPATHGQDRGHGGTGTDVTPTQTPDTAAPAQLTALRDHDLATVSFQGGYVAQLASKYPGITDPYQTAANGTHTFHAADILGEHLALRNGNNGNATVVLLLSTDYGKRELYNGRALWVTFALGDFPNQQAVLDWCASRFPQVSGDELGNQCAVRKLEPGQ